MGKAAGKAISKKPVAPSAPSVPKLNTGDLFPDKAGKATASTSKKGAKAAGSAAKKEFSKAVPPQFRKLGSAFKGIKKTATSVKQNGIAGSIKQGTKGATKSITKTTVKFVSKAAKKLAKESVKKGIQACLATAWCPAVIAALLFMVFLLSVIILSLGGGEDQIGDRADLSRDSQLEFAAAVERGEVFAGNNYLEWAHVVDLLGRDGSLVIGNNLSSWVIDWWARGGQNRGTSNVDTVNDFNATQGVRVLSQTPCQQAASSALLLRNTYFERVDRDDAADFDENTAEHFLFPRWSPELAEWLDNPGDVPPPASEVQDSEVALAWETRRLGICHTAATVLGAFERLVEWEGAIGENSVPDDAGDGVKAYLRMLDNNVGGFTDVGYRFLSLWISSAGHWRHVYATAVKPTTDNPSGLEPCALGNQIETWDEDTTWNGATALLHSCPPKTVDHTVCVSEADDLEARTPEPEGVPVLDEGIEIDDSVEPISSPACRLAVTIERCLTLNHLGLGSSEVSEDCDAEIEVLQAEMDSLREAAAEQEQALIEDLRTQSQAPPLLGGLLYQGGLPRYEALLVIGAALEELDGGDDDFVLFNEAQDVRIAKSLYAITCPDAEYSNNIERCEDGAPRNVEELLARDSDHFQTAWRDRLSSSGDVSEAVRCPWLARWHLGNVRGSCVQENSDASDGLLAVFGYSSSRVNLLGADCPQVSQVGRKLVVLDDHSSAIIKDSDDPRLTTIKSGGGEVFVHVCLQQPLSELLVWSKRVLDRPLIIASGWRSYDKQKELWDQHCDRHWLVTDPPPSCEPDTAPPGLSMHNTGLAVDFANCRTFDSLCFRWLQKNMPSDLLQNLLIGTEPWHWSINGL